MIAARAVDAGRTATDRVVVYRDTQAPRITITSPDSGTVLGIAGSGPARVDVSGRVELADEPHLATVVVSTAAGSGHRHRRSGDRHLQRPGRAAPGRACPPARRRP